MRSRAPNFFLVAAIWVLTRGPKHTTDDTTTATTRGTEVASSAIARPVPRVECVCSGHDGAVVLVARARLLVWCVTTRGAGANKAQAAAVAWWDVPWYVGRTKRHGVGFHSFHDSLKRSSSTSWPNRAGSTRNVNNNSWQSFNWRRSTTTVARSQSVVF